MQAASSLGWYRASDTRCWMALSGSLFFQSVASSGLTRASEGSEVEHCVPIACPWLDLLRFHLGPVCLVALLSRAPPCSVQPSLWPGFSFRSHQASSCQRPRSWQFQKCVWSCFVPRPNKWCRGAHTLSPASLGASSSHSGSESAASGYGIFNSLGALKGVAPLGRSPRF